MKKLSILLICFIVVGCSNHPKDIDGITVYQEKAFYGHCISDECKNRGDGKIHWARGFAMLGGMVLQDAFIASSVYSNSPIGNCYSHNDTASDGSLCGYRSAEDRDGGN